MATDLILIAYDGSDNAGHAIAVAGQLLGRGRRAVVVHAWEPASSARARSAFYALGYDDTPETVRQEQARADEVAQRGLEVAHVAGFEATSHARAGSGPLWSTIVDEAVALDPELIVLGTRGLTGVRAAVAGSVSHHVAQHAPCPVLTVPLLH